MRPLTFPFSWERKRERGGIVRGEDELEIKGERMLGCCLNKMGKIYLKFLLK